MNDMNHLFIESELLYDLQQACDLEGSLVQYLYFHIEHIDDTNHNLQIEHTRIFDKSIVSSK